MLISRNRTLVSLCVASALWTTSCPQAKDAAPNTLFGYPDVTATSLEDLGHDYGWVTAPARECFRSEYSDSELVLSSPAFLGLCYDLGNPKAGEVLSLKYRLRAGAKPMVVDALKSRFPEADCDPAGVDPGLPGLNWSLERDAAVFQVSEDRYAAVGKSVLYVSRIGFNCRVVSQ